MAIERLVKLELDAAAYLRQLDELRKAQQDAADSMKEVEKATKAVERETGNTAREMGRLTGVMNGISRSADQMRSSMRSAFAAFGGMSVLQNIAGQAAQISAEVDTLSKVAAATKLPIEEYQRFARALQLSGTDAAGARAALQKFAAGIDEFKRTGKGSAADTIKALGLDVNQPMEDVLRDLLSRTDVGLSQWTDLFGKQGRLAASTLAQSFDATYAQASTVTAVTQAQADALQDANDRIDVASDRMTAALTGATVAVTEGMATIKEATAEFAPVIEAAMSGFAGLIENAVAALRLLKDNVPTNVLLAFGEAFAYVGTGLAALGLAGLAAQFIALGAPIVTATAAVAPFALAVGAVGAGIGALIAVVYRITGAASTWNEAFTMMWADIKNFAAGIASLGRDVLEFFQIADRTALEEAEKAVTDLESRQGRLISSIKGIRNTAALEQEQYGASAPEYAEQVAELETELAEINTQLTTQRAKVDEINAAQAEQVRLAEQANQRQLEAKAAMEAAAAVTSEVADQTARAGDESEQLKAATEGATAALEATKEAAAKVAETSSMSAEQVKAASEHALILRDALTAAGQVSFEGLAGQLAAAAAEAERMRSAIGGGAVGGGGGSDSLRGSAAGDTLLGGVATRAGVGGSNKHLGALEDSFESRLRSFIEAGEAAGVKIALNSGYRSPERQAELFNAAVARYGSESAARRWVAPPGRSQHNFGTAADLSYGPGAQAWAHANASRFGLHYRMGHEPWHIEPSRSAPPMVMPAGITGGSGTTALVGSSAGDTLLGGSAGSNTLGATAAATAAATQAQAEASRVATEAVTNQNAAMTALNTTMAATTPAVQNVTTATTGLSTTVEQTTTAGNEMVATFAQGIGSAVGNGITAMINAIGKGEKPAKAFFKAVISGLANMASQLANKLIQNFINSLAGGTPAAGAAPAAGGGGGGGFFGSIFGGIGKIFSGLFGGLFDKGAAFAGTGLAHGVYSSPTFFNSSRRGFNAYARGGVGVLAERHAEAVMPLARGRGGKLGVVAEGAGSQPPSIVVNNSGPPMQATYDAERNRVLVETVKREIERDFKRGANPMTNSLETSYPNLRRRGL